MIIGVMAALYSEKLKRLLAYSTISHVGYMLIALTADSYYGNNALFLYVFIYIVMTLQLFTIVIYLQKANIIYIKQLAALYKFQFLLALCFALGLFSIAGIPPLAGFFSKFFLFTSALQSSLYSLTFVGILTSVIATFYYIRLIKLAFFESETFVAQRTFHVSVLLNINPISLDAVLGYILSFTTLILSLFFLVPQPLFLLVHFLAVA